MKQRTAPNWDEYGGRAMTIPFFVYGRDDLDVGPLIGFCRGHGGISGDEKSYQDKIGIYTAEGVYYNVLIDVRVKAVMPQFFIDGKPFFYPIVACYTICGGLPVIDPATGNMRTPHEKASSEAGECQEGACSRESEGIGSRAESSRLTSGSGS